MLTPVRPANAVLIPPGPLGSWVNRLVGRLAKAESIPVRLTDRNTDITQHADGSTLIVSQYPSRSLIEAIADGRLNAVVIMCDPALTAAYLMQKGSTVLEAVRALTGSMVAHLAVGATSRSRLVFAALEEPAAITSRRIAQALGLAHETARSKASAAQSATLSTAIAGANPEPPPLSPQHRRIVDSVTSGLVDLAEGRRDRPVVWPTEVFYWGDRPSEPAPRIASVIGPSRVMIYGPYFHLPPGPWNVELILAFSDAIKDIPFLLEIYGGQQRLGRFRIEGRPAGGYLGRLTFEVADPVAPIEIRLRNEQGSIEGEIALVEMRLSAADPASEFS